MHTRSGASLLSAAFALFACASCAGPAATGVARAPVPADARLQVCSTPSGARVILDGKPTGFRTPTEFPVPPGPHQVTVSLAGHGNAELPVRLEPGARQRVEARLTPLASGSLRVTSTPEGASILFDGEPTGLVTPAVIGNLTVGTHTVELLRPGFEDWCQAVVVSREQTRTLQAVLSPSRQSLGTLSVRSRPPRASISIDSRPTGKSTPAEISQLPAGRHRVDLELEGHRFWSGTVIVREGMTENLLVTLRDLPAQEVGCARIETDPPGATILLDGVALRQKSPAALDRLAPGTFRLELNRPGMRPWTGELTMLPGACADLAVRLEPQGRYGGSVRLESSPPGAAVIIDGVPSGAVTPVLLPNLAPSGHRLTLELPGFRPWTQMIHVGEGTMEAVQARLIEQPGTITVSVAAERGGELELAIRVLGPAGGPAAGVLELDTVAATGSWRETRLVLADGEARAVLVPAPSAAEVSISVGLGAERDVFVVRRTTTGWEITSP